MAPDARGPGRIPAPDGPVAEVPDEVWLPVLARRLGRPVMVGARSELAGGYHGGVVRVDLDPDPPVVDPGPAAPLAHRGSVDARPPSVSVVVKRARAQEVAALAVVPGVEHPRLLAAGADWIFTPFYGGAPLAEGPDVPDAVWTTLARVHAHWLGRRPRGLPVTDGAWWRHLCLARIRPHLGGRDDDPVYARGAAALAAWAQDERMHAALAMLPRTLTHGDPHRGNVLVPPPRGPSAHFATGTADATWQP